APRRRLRAPASPLLARCLVHGAHGVHVSPRCVRPVRFPATTTRVHAMSDAIFQGASAPAAVTTAAIRGSRKIYSPTAERPDIRVPFREITLSAGAGEPPLLVQDTSGPFTDP